MPKCRIKLELDELLKPGTVKHLLHKREILRSIVEDATLENDVEPSERFLQFDKAMEADIQRYVNNISQLEKEVQGLIGTVNMMVERRREDRAVMLNEVCQLYGTPLHMITERQRRRVTPKDSKKALPLLLGLVKNLYLEYSVNHKTDNLLKIMTAFEREEQNGFRMLLREAPYFNGNDRQGSQLAAEIDAAGTKRLLAFNIAKLALMLLRVIEDHPLGDTPGIKGNHMRILSCSDAFATAPSSEEVGAVIAGPDPKLYAQIDALWEKVYKRFFKPSEAIAPLSRSAKSVSDIQLQLAGDTHIKALPLFECKQALRTLVKLTQNLYQVNAMCGFAAQQRELDFAAREKKLYKDAYLQLIEKMDEQLAAASKGDADERNGPLHADASKRFKLVWCADALKTP